MNKIIEIFKKIKKERPLIHHITNWVTIYECANITRSLGALPVMAHSINEAADMAAISSALVLNIGTLTDELVEAMKVAGKTANLKKIPVVLDAVGVGSTRYRNEKTVELIREIQVDIIKGNASEIAKIAGLEVITRGVESTQVEEDLKKVAQKLAQEKASTVVITGKEDIVAAQNSIYTCRNGDNMMGEIVGTGCMVASILGAFAAVEKDYALSSISALAVFGISGEIAAQKSLGPGSFKEYLYDSIYNLSDNNIKTLLKVEKIS